MSTSDYASSTFCCVSHQLRWLCGHGARCNSSSTVNRLVCLVCNKYPLITPDSISHFLYSHHLLLHHQSIVIQPSYPVQPSSYSLLKFRVLEYRLSKIQLQPPYPLPFLLPELHSCGNFVLLSSRLNEELSVPCFTCPGGYHKCY